MSIWYQYSVTCLAEKPSDIAKFLGLSDHNDVWTDRFSFSFGCKNSPGLRLEKIVERNPDLIFLVKEEIECDTVSWWIDGFDAATQTYQHIFIYTDGLATTEVNEKIFKEYEKEFPHMTAKHLAGIKGYENFRWTSFFNYQRADQMLKNYLEYQEMITLITEDDILDNDYSHLLLDEEK